MNTKAIAYWATTAIITFELLAGGTTDLVRGREVLVVGQPVVAVLAHLGYPVYLLNILGVWKLLGAMALLAPGLPRLKEWAYAGTLFALTGAVASSIASGDSSADLIGPGFFAVCAVASWALRPQSRTLGALFSAKTWGSAFGR
jgi:DoxX-like family